MKKITYLFCILACCLLLVNEQATAYASSQDAGVSFYRDEEEIEETQVVKKEVKTYSKSKLPQTGETGMYFYQIAGIMLLIIVLKGGKQIGVKEIK